MMIFCILLQNAFTSNTRFVLLSGNEVEYFPQLQTIDELKEAIVSTINKYEDDSDFMLQALWEDKTLLQPRYTMVGNKDPTLHDQFELIAERMLQHEELIITILTNEPKQKFKLLLSRIQDWKSWRSAKKTDFEELHPISTQMLQWIDHNVPHGLLWATPAAAKLKNKTLLETVLRVAENKQDLLDQAIQNDLINIYEHGLSSESFGLLLAYGANPNVERFSQPLLLTMFWISVMFPFEERIGWRKLELLLKAGGRLDPSKIKTFEIQAHGVHNIMFYQAHCVEVVKHRCANAAQILLAFDLDAPRCELYD